MCVCLCMVAYFSLCTQRGHRTIFGVHSCLPLCLRQSLVQYLYTRPAGPWTLGTFVSLIPILLLCPVSLYPVLCGFRGSELKPACFRDKCFTQRVGFWSHSQYVSQMLRFTLTAEGILLLAPVRHHSFDEDVVEREHPEFLFPSNKIPRFSHNLFWIFGS